jgi:hypothetical protein
MINSFKREMMMQQRIQYAGKILRNSFLLYNLIGLFNISKVINWNGIFHFTKLNGKYIQTFST